jgi:hypothetical protein
MANLIPLPKYALLLRFLLFQSRLRGDSMSENVLRKKPNVSHTPVRYTYRHDLEEVSTFHQQFAADDAAFGEKCIDIRRSFPLKQRWRHSIRRTMAAALLRIEAWQSAIGRGAWNWVYTACVLRERIYTAVTDTLSDKAMKSLLRWRRIRGQTENKRHAKINMRILYCACGLFFFLTSYYTLSMEVIVDGQSLGFVSSQTEFQSVVNRVAEHASEILQYPYYLSPDVMYKYSFVDSHLLFNESQTEEMLFSQISEIKKLYVLTVDGEAVAANESREGLDFVLNEILDAYDLNGEADKVFFCENVSVGLQWVDETKEKPLEEIRALLQGNLRNEKFDIVKKGDSFSHVALRNGMSVSDLQSMNDEITPDNVEDGTPLVVRWTLPFLSVEAQKRIQYEEEIPFSSSTVEDGDLYVGDEILRVSGKPGVAQVTADLRYINGLQTNSRVVEKQEVVPPVSEVIAVGVKKRPPKMATGTFVRPYWGKYTSGFGVRTLLGVKKKPRRY